MDSETWDYTARVAAEARFNAAGIDHIPCVLCRRPTIMVMTKLCDRCWELKTRIERDPALARTILAAMKDPTHG